MAEIVLIRAEIVGTLPSDKKIVHLLADGADGIEFVTNEKSVIRPKTVLPDGWIDSYIDWLNSVGTEFASRDARAINAMMIKWETNPYLPDFGSMSAGRGDSGEDRPTDGCNADACDLI